MKALPTDIRTGSGGLEKSRQTDDKAMENSTQRRCGARQAVNGDIRAGLMYDSGCFCAIPPNVGRRRRWETSQTPESEKTRTYTNNAQRWCGALNASPRFSWKADENPRPCPCSFRNDPCDDAAGIHNVSYVSTLVHDMLCPGSTQVDSMRSYQDMRNVVLCVLHSETNGSVWKCNERIYEQTMDVFARVFLFLNPCCSLTQDVKAPTHRN